MTSARKVSANRSRALNFNIGKDLVALVLRTWQTVDVRVMLSWQNKM